MIKHVVMFRFKAEAEGATKGENLVKVKALLNGLVGEVEGLEAMEVGINFNPTDAAFDLVLTSTHKDEEGLQAYGQNPTHLKVVDFIKKVVEDRKVVDYRV